VLVAAICSGYVPAAVPAATVIARFVVPVPPPLRVTDAGLKDLVMPPDVTGAGRFTTPLKLLPAVTITVEEVAPPACTEAGVVALNENEGADPHVSVIGELLTAVEEVSK